MTTYAIKTVADFRGIPEERREACLKEFITWLNLADFVAENAAGIVRLDTSEFRWIDDGKRNIYPHVVVEP